jgi:Uma2 family endonuclease
LIEIMALELDIGIQSVGSTTFFRAMGARGLQPDRSYYVANEPRVRGKEEYDPETDPPPDLVVEVDLTSSCVARMPVYATLRVPELWRYSTRKLTFFGLSRRGQYREVRHSKAFRFLRPADLMRFLDMRHDTDENSVIRAFVAWLRESHAKPAARKPRRKK